MARHRGIIVEGPSDEKVVRAIAAKLKIPVEVRVAKGKPELIKKMDSYALLLRDCKKVIALVDSHCTEVSKVEKEIKSLRRNPREIEICIIKHAIESWFLADVAALQTLLSKRIKSIGNPEKFCKPEEKLDRLFKNTGKEYIKTRDAVKLAEQINFEKVEKKCRSFKSFIELLRDC